MTRVPPNASDAARPPRSIALRIATGLVIALHGALLVAALPDLRVSVDSAYHVALGRQYAKHVVYFWDDVHYAPTGRPNLQGPLVHALIAVVGSALGGGGDDFVAANAALGVACWLGAVLTVAFLAWRWGGGDRGALLGVAAFAGSAYAAGSFYVNIPSGWMFVLAAWAIHFFVVGRLALASAVAALACYAHLGGFATVPVGLAVAALLTRRWRDLALVLGGLAVLTAPYWIHFLRSLAFYVGQKGDTGWMVDPLVWIFWLLGVAYALRRPRERAFLVAWVASPILWLVQDPSRFLLQSPLAGAALGAIAIAGWIERRRFALMRGLVTALLVLLATVFPLGVPGLGVEATWLVNPYPRLLDWEEMRTDAEVIRRAGLEDRILWGYASYVPSAIAVWADTRGERGHWVEVQPPEDAALRVGLGEKAFLLPLPPLDARLVEWQAKGLVRIHGGGRWSSIVTFERRPDVEEADALARAAWAEDAAWVAASCEHNALGDWRELAKDPREVPRRARERGYCRTRVARIAAALLLESYANEPVDPERAAAAARAARVLGWAASLVGDEATLDFRTSEAHAAMREDMGRLATAARSGTGIEEAFARLIGGISGGKRGGL